MGNFDKGVYLFDVDGTLTDTGPAHARFCNDLNNEFGFGLPLVDETDSVAVKRVLGTPMRTLLSKYGFPEERLSELDSIYARRFSEDAKYASKPFQGIPEMLRTLSETDRALVLLTSNIYKNVKRDLGEGLINLFDIKMDREFMQKRARGDKSLAILQMMAGDLNGTPVHDVVCVGDVEKDFIAARNAGCRFVGVTYGWQIQADEKRFRVANSVGELQEILLASF